MRSSSSRSHSNGMSDGLPESSESRHRCDTGCAEYRQSVYVCKSLDFRDAVECRNPDRSANAMETYLGVLTQAEALAKHKSERSAEVRNGVSGMSKLIIESHLGRTDCTGCRIYQKHYFIFAIPVCIRGNDLAEKYPKLPIKVAELPSKFAAERALWRIRFAIETDKKLDIEEITVDLRDLQGY